MAKRQPALPDPISEETASPMTMNRRGPRARLNTPGLTRHGREAFKWVQS